MSLTFGVLLVCRLGFVGLREAVVALQALFQERSGAAQRSCAKAPSTGVPTMWLV
jgi:hypothetical protein